MGDQAAVSNPWTEQLSQAPFVLEMDREAVSSFNKDADENTRIQDTLLPEPFVGRLDAPVVLLLLNPGVHETDFSLHLDPGFRSQVSACLAQRSVDFPNYYLHPAADGSGARWWKSKFGKLIDATSLDAVAKNVVAIEFFPYHSVSFGHALLRLPSQAFTFAAVRNAIARDAHIIIGRGAKFWQGAVPELKRAKHRHVTRSTQNVTMSRANLPDAFEQIVAAVSG